MIKRLRLLAIIGLVILAQTSAMAEDSKLCHLADNKGVIKVFLNEPVNESGQGQIITDNLKKSIESALVNRKSTKFEIVKTPQEGDVQISSVIKKFMYMEKGPLKLTPDITTVVLDAAETMTENYVEMTVAFIVTNPKTGGVLWSDTLNPYMKKKMNPEQSIPVISDKVASHLMWKCFGKPSN